MHPATLIFAWLVGVALLQPLTGVPLAVVLGLCALVAHRLAPARSLRLVRRVRILLVAIVVLFAWLTPGEALFVDVARFSPTREGLELALEHAARLLAVVLCVAVLMQRLSHEQLVTGLHALLSPLDWMGVPSARIAVRTLLVIGYVESASPRHWRAWLVEDGGELPPPVQLRRQPCGWADRAVCTVFAVLPLFWWSVF